MYVPRHDVDLCSRRVGVWSGSRFLRARSLAGYVADLFFDAATKVEFRVACSFREAKCIVKGVHQTVKDLLCTPARLDLPWRAVSGAMPRGTPEIRISAQSIVSGGGHGQQNLLVVIDSSLKELIIVVFVMLWEFMANTRLDLSTMDELPWVTKLSTGPWITTFFPPKKDSKLVSMVERYSRLVGGRG